MDLPALREQIIFSNKTASEKAKSFLLQRKVIDLSKDEWRELIAEIPEEVEEEIGILMSPGQSDLQAKMDHVHDAINRHEAQAQAVKVAISPATPTKRKLGEGVSGVQFVHSVPPVFEKAKRQRLQQQLSPLASINKFVWTGDKDTAEEIERFKLRLQALIGWDEFPSEMEFRDVHTQMLFDVRIEDESHQIESLGKSDIALQHTVVEPGGLIEHTFLLLQAENDLSRGALEAAEAKAYMQYVAFGAAAHRYVPVLLTDGNVFVLYVHNTRLSAHQRMYWDQNQILDASVYLAELVKQIVLSNPLTRGCIPGHDDQPEFPDDPGTEHKGPSMDYDDIEQDDNNPMTKPEPDHGALGTAGSICLGYRHVLTEKQNADVQKALQLARFHPCVTAVYDLPPYAKPNPDELAS